MIQTPVQDSNFLKRRSAQISVPILPGSSPSPGDTAMRPELKMNSSPMQYVKTSDDVRVAYLSLGDGPPLVFASNIFGDAHNYRTGWPHVREVTDQLVALGWRVVRYDHRGM